MTELGRWEKLGFRYRQGGDCEAETIVLALRVGSAPYQQLPIFPDSEPPDTEAFVKWAFSFTQILSRIVRKPIDAQICVYIDGELLDAWANRFHHQGPDQEKIEEPIDARKLETVERGVRELCAAIHLEADMDRDSWFRDVLHPTVDDVLKSLGIGKVTDGRKQDD